VSKLLFSISALPVTVARITITANKQMDEHDIVEYEVASNIMYRYQGIKISMV
jgi:hypothetical protein